MLEALPSTFVVNSNYFGPEMMIRGHLARFRCVQIRVNYRERVGESPVTGAVWKAFRSGLRMIVLIVSMRLGLNKLIGRLIG